MKSYALKTLSKNQRFYTIKDQNEINILFMNESKNCNIIFNNFAQFFFLKKRYYYKKLKKVKEKNSSKK